MLYIKSPKTQKCDKALSIFVPLPWKRAHGPPFFFVFFYLVWHKLQEKPWFVELLWSKKVLGEKSLDVNQAVGSEFDIDLCLISLFAMIEVPDVS